MELAFTNRPAKEFSNTVYGRKYQQSSLFCRYTRRFGCTVCNTFSRSKKRGGGSNRILNIECAKETMLSEIRVRPPFIISSCTVYSSWLFRSQRSACETSAEQSAVYLQKRQKEQCNSFSLSKGGKAQWFLNLPQMRTNNYGESSIMTWRRVKTGSI